MTDEEMADKWVDKEISLGTSMYNPQKENYSKQAFLAGLKAGRPQWHDLRKDKNNLPKDSKEVLIITSDNRKHIGFYDKDWYCSECGGIVIKWCEINF